MTHPPASFGRADDNPAPQPFVVTMPDQLPAVTMPVIIAVDPESLAKFSRELAEVVTAAVRAGYATALEDIEFEAEEAGNYEHPTAEFREKLAEFLTDNDDLLKRIARPAGTDSAGR